jgi:Mal s 1 allergenic protein-like
MSDKTISGSRKAMLDFPCDVERLANGNTLITDAGDELGAGSEIIEVNPQGKVVWHYDDNLKFAHSAKRLENGNTLIADTNNNRVLEVSAAGQLLWSSDSWGDSCGTLSDGTHLDYPNKAKMLDDGNICITDRNNDRALIVSRQGKVIWQYAGEIKHPHNATILENGNLLIADSDGQYVSEFTREGDIAWSYGDGTSDMLNWPRDADRLENGNTLITDSKHARIIEVSPQGDIVWQYQSDHYANFYDADRLPNGNTLMADQQHQQVIEVDPDGRQVWFFRNFERPYPVVEKILNSRFEDWDDDGSPSDWYLCRRLAEGGGQLINAQTAAGKKIPGLQYDRDGGIWLQQTRKVVPGKSYRVSGLISTEEVEGVACLQVAFADQKGGMLCDGAENPKSELLSGSTAVSRQLFTALAPEGAVTADIRVFISGKGRIFVEELFCFG